MLNTVQNFLINLFVSFLGVVSDNWIVISIVSYASIAISIFVEPTFLFVMMILLYGGVAIATVRDYLYIAGVERVRRQINN